MKVRAVLDACVLIPMPLADTLLHLAEGGHFEPIWSAELLDETRRNLGKLGVGPERAVRRIELMQKAFPWAAAEPPAEVLEAMTVDEKDKHVAATAVVARATHLVTQNLKDFPVNALTPYGITVIHPDDFTLDLLDADPVGVLEAVDRQRRRLRAPSLTDDEFRRLLARTVPQFSAELALLDAAAAGETFPEQMAISDMPLPIVAKTPEELSDAFFPGGKPDALTPSGVMALWFTAVVQFDHPESPETLRRLSYDPEHWGDYAGLPSMIKGFALTQARHPDIQLPEYVCYFKLMKTDAGGQVFADHVITDPILWVMLARNDLYDPWRVLAVGSQPWVELDGDHGGPAPIGELPGQ